MKHKILLFAAVAGAALLTMGQMRISNESGGVMSFADGLVGTPSLHLTSDATSGWYSSGAGKIDWSGTGSKRFEIGADYAQVTVANGRLIANTVEWKQLSTSGWSVGGTGASPTITGAFGTSNTIAGKNSSFTVNVGTATATTGTVTFAGTWTNIPNCVASIQSAVAADQRTIGIVTTTTTAQFAFAVGAVLTAPTASNVMSVLCFGQH